MVPRPVAPGAWYVEGLPAQGTPANQSFIANSGFVVTAQGVVVIDALGSPALAQRLLEQIRSITAQPVTHVIVTHYHPDHFYGLQTFQAMGARIVAHRAARDYLRSDAAQLRLRTARQDMAPWVNEQTRLIEADQWLDDEQVLTVGGVQFQIKPMGPAHTQEDLVVYLPEKKLLFTGDLVFRNRLPFVGQADSGRWIKMLDALLAFDATAIVPGHGPASMQGHADLQLTRDYLSHLRATMGQAAKNMEPFEAAYQAADWHRFEPVPMFSAVNRINAYSRASPDALARPPPPCQWPGRCATNWRWPSRAANPWWCWSAWRAACFARRCANTTWARCTRNKACRWCNWNPGLAAQQPQPELVREVRVRHLGVRRLGPDPVALGEKRPHGIDVAVVGRPRDHSLLACRRTDHLHEQNPETAARPQPLPQLAGVLEPIVGMKRAQTGLLVDGVKRLGRLIGQHVGLNDVGRREPTARQQRPGLLHRRRRVVQPRNRKAALGQLGHLPAATAARHRDTARLQLTAVQPCQELRTGAAPVPAGFIFLKPFLPKFGGRACHAGYSVVGMEASLRLGTRGCLKSGIGWPRVLH